MVLRVTRTGGCEHSAPSFLSVSRRVTVAVCESAHNWIGALERGLWVCKCNELACISSGRCSSVNVRGKRALPGIGGSSTGRRALVSRSRARSIRRKVKIIILNTNTRQSNNSFRTLMFYIVISFRIHDVFLDNLKNTIAIHKRYLCL